LLLKLARAVEPVGIATAPVHEGARSHVGHLPQSRAQSAHDSPTLQTPSPQTPPSTGASTPGVASKVAQLHAPTEPSLRQVWVPYWPG
jgi:hypothetical protein